jgi:hypothetical protein
MTPDELTGVTTSATLVGPFFHSAVLAGPPSKT